MTGNTPATGRCAVSGRPDASLWLASATNFLLTYGFALALVTGIAMYIDTGSRN